LRPGEALGLEVRNVRERTLLVEQAAAHGRLKLQKTGRAYRTVDLLGVLRADLQQWIATVAGDDRSRLIFGRSDGGHFRLDD
jgi:integrase